RHHPVSSGDALAPRRDVERIADAGPYPCNGRAAHRADALPMNAGRNSMRGSTLRRWALGAAVLVAVHAGAEDLPQPPGLPPDTEAAEAGTSVVARRTDPEGPSAASRIELTAPPTGAELVGKKPE